ncbi:MAG: hypothetical protein HYW95_02285 [Candidatus Wildermuthbacteria bacterium]|nr:hypothetical protein [Candidatus Wildermuthbacteria bacterium]
MTRVVADSYLHIGRASDIENPHDRTIYRLLEIFPGCFTLVVFLLAFLFSWLFPVGISIFIIVFIVYWFVRLIYFSFHLQYSYRQMRRNEKIDWVKELEKLSPAWKDIFHLILIPTYREPLDVLRGTLLSLKNAHYPKERMIVVLGIEERAGPEGRMVASLLQKEFENCFFRFHVAFHPANIAGEIAGKASNETWAVKEVKKEIIDALSIPYDRILVTSLDADTIVYPEYFGRLTHVFLTTPDPLHCSFQPVPLFLNNIMEVPAISRVFSFNSTFWHMMNQSRPEKLITFSSHAMNFQALVDVGFKQTNVVSDDSRIFWQCYLYYNGNYQTIPLYYPISMDANVAPRFLDTLKNIYKQQRRWAYGVADVPYFLFGFLKNKRISLSKKISPGWEVFFGFWSWATASILILFLGWLPLVLGGQEFAQSLLSYNLPRLATGILRVGIVGLIGSVYLSILLFPINVKQFGMPRIVFFVLQWLLLPFVMIFSSIPAIEAQIRLMFGKYLGFWSTPKFRKLLEV